MTSTSCGHVKADLEAERSVSPVLVAFRAFDFCVPSSSRATEKGLRVGRLSARDLRVGHSRSFTLRYRDFSSLMKDPSSHGCLCRKAFYQPPGSRVLGRPFKSNILPSGGLYLAELLSACQGRPQRHHFVQHAHLQSSHAALRSLRRRRASCSHALQTVLPSACVPASAGGGRQDQI